MLGRFCSRFCWGSVRAFAGVLFALLLGILFALLLGRFCSRFSLPPSPVCLSPQFARSSFPPLAWCTSRMGIDTEFRRLLAARYDESFGEGALLQRDGLLVVDLLTNMFSAIGPQYN